MTTFWGIAAAMLLVALVTVLPSLWRRPKVSGPARDEANVAIYKDRLAELQADVKHGILTQEQLAQVRAELQQHLLQDVSGDRTPHKPPEITVSPGRWGALVVSFLVPLLAVGLYLQLGNPDALSVDVNLPNARPGGDEIASIDELAARLARRLEKEDDDAEGWYVLARSYAVMGRWAEAGQAYGRVRELVGDNAPLLINHAYALAQANEGQFVGQPMRLLERALKLQPNHRDALWLWGLGKFQQGDYASALTDWQRLAAQLPEDDLKQRQQLDQLITEAKTRAEKTTGRNPVAQAGSQKRGAQISSTASDRPLAGSEAPPSAGTKGQISVQVDLAPALADKVSPEDTVFILARARTGPHIPLAVVRRQVSEIPLTVSFDDSMAMMPAMALSNFEQIVIEAHVSKSGQTTRQHGDLVGQSGPIQVHRASASVKVTIDTQVP
jgi:cytochrome c-type biogenesis protein CcmH